MRFYISTFLTAFVCAFVGVGLVTYTNHNGRPPNFGFEQLVSYQQNKIKTGLPATIFVGDSSLGNAVSAEYWNKSQKQTKIANLALTGLYGYAGSYQMIKEAVLRNNIRNVVVLQTVDMMTRSVAQNAIAQVSIFEWSLSGVLRLWKKHMYLFNVIDAGKFFLKDLVFDKPVEKNSAVFQLANDYIKQNEALEPLQAWEGISIKSIQTEKVKYLNKIKQLCSDMKLNCIYAFGPLLMEVCEKSEAYFKEQSLIISTTGIKLAHEKPFCIPMEQIGDSVDHVSPLYKIEYTKKYMELLQPLLTPSLQREN